MLVVLHTLVKNSIGGNKKRMSSAKSGANVRMNAVVARGRVRTEFPRNFSSNDRICLRKYQDSKMG